MTVQDSAAAFWLPSLRYSGERARGEGAEEAIRAGAAGLRRGAVPPHVGPSPPEYRGRGENDATESRKVI